LLTKWSQRHKYDRKIAGTVEERSSDEERISAEGLATKLLSVESGNLLSRFGGFAGLRVLEKRFKHADSTGRTKAFGGECLKNPQ